MRLTVAVALLTAPPLMVGETKLRSGVQDLIRSVQQFAQSAKLGTFVRGNVRRHLSSHPDEREKMSWHGKMRKTGASRNLVQRTRFMDQSTSKPTLTLTLEKDSKPSPNGSN